VTQVDLIRRHLETGKTITPSSAMTVYGISRLSSVIEDLRNAGHEVDMVLKRDEMGKQYGEYALRRPIPVDASVQVKPGHGMGLPVWVRKQKLARVIGKFADTSLVRFVRGNHMADIWLNDKELVNAS
jgi:hypothetical protein